MAILTVENLGHSFGDRTLFKDVSFRLVEGDHIGLVGANGVGKSTLMSIITGQTIHDTGKVEWLPSQITSPYIPLTLYAAPTSPFFL